MSLSERLNKDNQLNSSHKKAILKLVKKEIKQNNNFFNTSIIDRSEFKDKLYILIAKILEREFPGKKYVIGDELIEASLSEIFGLGILEKYLSSKTVTDIFIQDTEMVIIENGKKKYLGKVFKSLEEVYVLIDKISHNANKTIDQRLPFLNTELYEGSRCSIVIPPISDRVYISIRVFNCLNFMLKDLLSLKMFASDTYKLLLRSVEDRKNILIAGAMGSGKTTLLNTLAKEIPENEFINIIQDVPEINISDHPYVRLLTTRPRSREIDNEIKQDRLVYETLRMKADRIIIGEIRNSTAAYQMLQALNTGHRGSFSTIHADSALDALLRLETLAMEYKENISNLVVKRIITRAIDMIIYLAFELDKDQNIKKREIKEILKVDNLLDRRGEYKLSYLH
ncbi:MAG: CpaF family protein [Actinomycetota bacterium]